jgi:SAM-dependent methyltransferase
VNPPNAQGTPRRRLYDVAKVPFGFVKRALWKKLLGPIRYAKGRDYDAERYWHDRFAKYGWSLKGPGHEGWSEKKNEEVYAKAGQQILELCRDNCDRFPYVRVLDVGVGTGFYTRMCRDGGVRNYLGIDITDLMFEKLAKEFTEFRFAKMDVSRAQICGQFELILMIDVVQHIVDDAKLDFAMNNVKGCLAENGLFILSGIIGKSKRHLFYVRSWSLEDIRSRFAGHEVSDPIPFRDNNLVLIRKKSPGLLG